MKTLKTGSRLKSAICDTEVMVIRASADELLLSCGGVEMTQLDAERVPGMEIDPLFGLGTLVGKRYVDEHDSVELLCTKGGKGSLSINEKPLVVKQAKALPSSD